jgi:hypothetical protein
MKRTEIQRIKHTKSQKKYVRKHREEYKAYMKMYHKKHKKYFEDYNKKYRLEHIDELKEYDKQYNINNKENQTQYNKLYYLKNKDKIRQDTKTYYLENKEKMGKARLEYERKKAKTDIGFNIVRGLRSRIRNVLNGNIKYDSTKKLVGCSIEKLKQYMESKFQSGMNWKNHGYRGWHIDHIKPCASFDLSKPSEQRKCFHYSNLQPLWAKDNMKKGKKYEE